MVLGVFLLFPALGVVMRVLRRVFRLDSLPARLLPLDAIENHAELGEFELAATRKYGSLELDIVTADADPIVVRTTPTTAQEVAEAAKQLSPVGQLRQWVFGKPQESGRGKESS